MENPPSYEDHESADIHALTKAKALENIKAVIKGNGVNPDALEIKSYEPDVAEFLAVLTLKPEPKLSIKRQGGKVSGPQLVENANMFPEAAQKEIVKITRSKDVINRIKDDIFKRKDKGIGLQNRHLQFQYLNKDFVSHESCTACKGQGKTQCQNCHGKGVITCPRCHGRGTETCPTCGGRQYITGPNGEQQLCQRCNGTGRISCSLCHEARTITCQKCNGAGTLTCQQCNGHGWMSALCHAEIELITHYDFDKENLKPEIVPIIENLGSTIQEHAIIGLVERHKDDEKETQNIEIFYHIKAPIADAAFTLKSLEIPALIFGTQGDVYNAPPFLEKILDKGIKALKSAAKGEGNVAQNLQTAGRYKTLRLIIMASAKTSPAKALKAVMARTPIGLSEDTAKKLITMTSMALKTIGKKPKIMGVALGSAITTAAFLTYIFALKSQIIPQIPAPEITVDAGAALIAAGIGYLAGSWYTKTTIQKILSKLLG